MDEDDDASELDAPIPDDADSELAALVAPLVAAALDEATALLDETVALLDETGALLEDTALEVAPADEECAVLLEPAVEDDDGAPLLELVDASGVSVPGLEHWPHASGPRNTRNNRPWEHFMRIHPHHKGPVQSHTPNTGLTREETPGQGARP
jgi:hypothetical protein